MCCWADVASVGQMLVLGYWGLFPQVCTFEKTWQNDLMDSSWSYKNFNNIFLRALGLDYKGEQNQYPISRMPDPSPRYYNGRKKCVARGTHLHYLIWNSWEHLPPPGTSQFCGRAIIPAGLPPPSQLGFQEKKWAFRRKRMGCGARKGGWCVLYMSVMVGESLQVVPACYCFITYLSPKMHNLDTAELELEKLQALLHVNVLLIFLFSCHISAWCLCNKPFVPLFSCHTPTKQVSPYAFMYFPSFSWHALKVYC